MSTHSIDKGTTPSHHFGSVAQERSACLQGTWLFLATEVLMFGGLFVAYAIYRGKYPELFQAGSALLSVPLGTLNTIVLLISSFTMASSIHYIHENEPKIALRRLWLTFFLACGFLVVKYFEYSHKIHAGTLPNAFFSYEGGPENLAMFFGFYFVMTGLHGIHIVVGMGLMLWLIKRMKRGDFSGKYFTPVEGVGLYWHIVDIIWIYLFPLLYLI